MEEIIEPYQFMHDMMFFFFSQYLGVDAKKTTTGGYFLEKTQAENHHRYENQARSVGNK